MKLISLNLWGGRLFEPLASFLETKGDIDIFCFQEIYHNAKSPMTDIFRQPNLALYTNLKELLPKYQSFFRGAIRDEFGLGIFLKNNITVEEEGDILLYENPDFVSGGNHTRNMQWAKIQQNKKDYTIFNVHGFHNENKLDSPERLEQSQRIKKMLDTTQGSKILCGDFNLAMETQSMRMLEDNMLNLVRQHGIPSTRTHFYTKPVKVVDYVLVSPDVDVKEFVVMPDVVSDHSPLLLEFE